MKRADPLVIYAYGNTMSNQARASESLRWIELASERLGPTGYLPRLVAMAAGRLARTYDHSGQSRESGIADAEARRALLDMAADPAYLAMPRFTLWVMNFDFIRDAPMAQHELLYNEAVARGDIDPWVEKMLGVYYHIRQGWDERGVGWAYEVTEKGWAGFQRHLSQASVLAAEAHALHPEFPEAATQMIMICMAGHGPPGTDERLWFDRAVAAEFDHLEAYNRLITSMMPRWGGSLERLLAFAIECAATGRFDTDVPWYYITTLQTMHVDMGSYQIVLAIPGVYDRLANVVTGYRSKPESVSRSSEWFDCYLLAAAWHAGRIDEAVAIYDALEYEQLEESAFDWLRFDMHTTLMLLAGTTHEDGEPSKRVFELMRDRKYDEAIALCDATAAPFADNPGHPIFKYFKHHAWVAERMKAFDAGEAVDIMPGPLLRGWLINAGRWWQEQPGGDLNGASVPAGLALACDLPVHDDFEITGRFQVIDSPYRDQRNGGVMIDLGPSPWMTSVTIEQSGRKAALKYRGNNDTILETPAKTRIGWNTFRVRFENGHVSAWSNDRQFMDNVERPRPLWGELGRPGVGGIYWYANAIVRFGELKIRRVD